MKKKTNTTKKHEEDFIHISRESFAEVLGLLTGAGLFVILLIPMIPLFSFLEISNYSAIQQGSLIITTTFAVAFCLTMGILAGIGVYEDRK